MVPTPAPLPSLVLPAQAGGLDPAVLVVIVGAAILSLSFHEAAHAWTARAFGDDTAEREGRLTLNPLAHVDLVMTVLVPIITYVVSNGAGFFGGARPVPVNPNRLRHPHRDNAVVAIAGPLSNLLLATLFLAVFHAVWITGDWDDKLLPRLLIQIAQFNVLLAVFNLVPIPPLDGSRVVRWLLPDSLRGFYTELERYGLLIIVALVFLYRPFQAALFRTIQSVTEGLYWLVQLGGLW